MATDKSVMAVIRAARPSFRNDHDKAAFAVHATFLSSGYLLTAAGPQALSDDTLSHPSTEEVSVENWNQLDQEYAFVYVNPEKVSNKVLVKCLVMNEKLLIDALKEGSSDPAHLEICVRDYTIANESSNYSEQFKNLEQLVRRLNQDILAKLDGSSTSSSASNPPRSGSREARQEIHEPPVGFGGHGGAPIHPSGVIYPPVNPVGGSDLFPGPPAGVYPTWGDPGTGGSMLVGPNDPRWFGGEPPFPGGQPGVPPGVPPGARFDPFGPPDVPGFEPNRFQRRPPRQGNNVHPDLEHFRRDGDFI
ncbi:probable proteasome inhibitor [Arachis stenosperma]|uniref:probable proteasome inhibitor n=1 Tax=Arachis stenosperma TaxID=217475 RepID=UPI0025ACA7E3|nr:probable proteasome inhibitor [Arachis stenosperma]